MERDLDIDFVQGMPCPVKIKEIFDGEHHIICLDDLQQEVANSREAEKLFTQLSQHNNLSVVYLNQNLYYQGRCARTLNLNTAYTVLLKNPRNTQQLALLGRQLDMGSALKSTYLDATSKPYGYLVVDLSLKSDERYRLRSNVFPEESPVVVYQ